VSLADIPLRETPGGESFSLSEFEALKSEQKRLTHEVAQLRAMVQQMASELGITLNQSSSGD
jgi:hypothetical protein